MDTQEKTRLLQNWNDERNSAMIYQALTDAEKDERIAEVYQRMIAVELRHADKWAGMLKDGGETVPDFRPTFRIRLLNQALEMVWCQCSFTQRTGNGTKWF